MVGEFTSMVGEFSTVRLMDENILGAKLQESLHRSLLPIMAITVSNLFLLRTSIYGLATCL